MLAGVPAVLCALSRAVSSWAHFLSLPELVLLCALCVRADCVGSKEQNLVRGYSLPVSGPCGWGDIKAVGIQAGAAR